MSQREIIVSAVTTKLLAASLVGGRIYRDRLTALTTLPAISVESAQEKSKDEFLGYSEKELTVNVQIFANAATVVADTDAVIDSVASIVMLDRSLGVSPDVDVKSEYEVDWDFTNTSTVRVTLAFHVRHRLTV